MLSPSQERQRAEHIANVLGYMRKSGLSLDDLTEIGGEDLKSTNPPRAEKARRVERCWALIAQRGIKFDDLADAVGKSPDFLARRPRHRRPTKQPVDIAGVSQLGPTSTNPSNNKDLAVSSEFGGSEVNFTAKVPGDPGPIPDSLRRRCL
jgi:hypothetical protein